MDIGCRPFYYLDVVRKPSVLFVRMTYFILFLQQQFMCSSYIINKCIIQIESVLLKKMANGCHTV